MEFPDVCDNTIDGAGVAGHIRVVPRPTLNNLRLVKGTDNRDLWRGGSPEAGPAGGMEHVLDTARELRGGGRIPGEINDEKHALSVRRHPGEHVGNGRGWIG